MVLAQLDPHRPAARGNITLPPYTVVSGDSDGVTAKVTFRSFHLGGNNAAHGGHIAQLSTTSSA